MRPRKFRVELYSCFNLGDRWGVYSTLRPGIFTRGKDPVPTVQEAGWAPGPVWKDAENLAAAGIRSSYLPARIQSLSRATIESS